MGAYRKDGWKKTGQMNWIGNIAVIFRAYYEPDALRVIGCLVVNLCTVMT